MDKIFKDMLETRNDGDSKYWIDLFSSIPPHQVGVIKSSGKLIAGKNFEQLCAEIRTLTNHGLFLPLVIGGGVQYDQLPAYVDSFKVNGLRVTSDALIKDNSSYCNQESIPDCTKTEKIWCRCCGNTF